MFCSVHCKQQQKTVKQSFCNMHLLTTMAPVGPLHVGLKKHCTIWYHRVWNAQLNHQWTTKIELCLSNTNCSKTGLFWFCRYNFRQHFDQQYHLFPKHEIYTHQLGKCAVIKCAAFRTEVRKIRSQLCIYAVHALVFRLAIFKNALLSSAVETYFVR